MTAPVRRLPLSDQQRLHRVLARVGEVLEVTGSTQMAESFQINDLDAYEWSLSVLDQTMSVLPQPIKGSEPSILMGFVNTTFESIMAPRRRVRLNEPYLVYDTNPDCRIDNFEGEARFTDSMSWFCESIAVLKQVVFDVDDDKHAAELLSFVLKVAASKGVLMADRLRYLDQSTMYDRIPSEIAIKVLTPIWRQIVVNFRSTYPFYDAWLIGKLCQYVFTFTTLSEKVRSKQAQYKKGGHTLNKAEETITAWSEILVPDLSNHGQYGLGTAR